MLGSTSNCYLGVATVVSVNYFVDSSLALGRIAWVFQENMRPFECASNLRILAREGTEDNRCSVDGGVFVEPPGLPEAHLAFLKSGLTL